MATADTWLRLDFAWPDVDVPLRALPGVGLYRATDGDSACAFVDAASSDAQTLVPRLTTLLPDLRVVRLTRTQRLDGAAAGRHALFRYIVATDVAPAHEHDFNAWYTQEHLPGLAAVPGTVLAQRFTDPAGSPRYHACYDLAVIETFNSPAWLAVRATPWSSRVRPNFRQTRRTMYRRVGGTAD